MTTADESGYRIRDTPFGLGRTLQLLGPWRPSLAGIMDAHDARGLRMSDRAGWPPDDIDFVDKLSLNSIEIVADSTIDVGPIECQASLELLHLDCEISRRFDAGSLPIAYALISWPRKGIDGVLESPSLEVANITRYPGESLRPLASERLERLDVTSRRLTSLSGIDRLRSLRHIDLLDCRELETFNAVGDAESLEIFSIDSNKHLTTVAPFATCARLKRLNLTNVPNLESVYPLVESRSITHLFLRGSTRVADGDLRCLLDMPQLEAVTFRNRRGYNVDYASFRAELERRHGPTQF